MEGHISISGLSHTYVDKDVQTTTLIDINLQASRGEFVSVVGPSGAGKTTLLKTIGGLVKPSSGQIFINGNSPQKVPSIEVESGHYVDCYLYEGK